MWLIFVLRVGLQEMIEGNHTLFPPSNYCTSALTTRESLCLFSKKENTTDAYLIRTSRSAEGRAALSRSCELKIWPILFGKRRLPLSFIINY